STWFKYSKDSPRIVRKPYVYTRHATEVYAKLPDGEVIGNNKHYVVCPPSAHPSGIVYRWLNGPPLGVSEFPRIDPEAAGFLRATPAPHDPRSKGERPQNLHRTKTNNDMCATSQTPALTDLPADVRECVLRTSPARAGQRNHKLLALARALRDCVPAGDAQLRYDAVRVWWSLALPVLGTRAFAATLSDFRRDWEAVRVPTSQSRPKLLMRQAADEAQEEGGDRCDRLKRVCVGLAAAAPDGVFFLSVRDAAASTDIPFRTAARMLKGLTDGGFLEVVSAGVPSATSRMATSFRVREMGVRP
uniref:hypothetical protein n=1 Tax=Gemmata sp. TaxID=1914242 RepID=UPI003F72B06B